MAGAVALAACVALTWPLALHLGTWHSITTFGDSHVWVLEWIRRTLLAGGIPHETTEVGYPYVRDARPIALVPAAIFAVLRVALSPLAAANVLQLLSLPASAIAAYALVCRWTDADRWTAAPLAVAWALSPTLLSTLGMGEISNTQAWILPIFLLALDADWRGLPLLVAASAVTSPYYALAFPLIAVARAGWLRTRAAALAVVLVGLGLLPAWALYAAGQPPPPQQVFQPAHYTHAEDLPAPAPVARPEALLLGLEARESRPEAPSHVAYLGIVLVIAGAVARGRGRGGRAGAALAVGGVILALGPQLAVGEHYVRVGGWPVPLPVMALELVGYPTKTAGLYFRYAVLAELGLVVVVAAGLAGRRYAAPIAWILAALHVADAVRETGPLWPRPSAPIPDAELVRSLAGKDGAVLDLPLPGQQDVAPGQAAMLRAVLHGRPTSALPRGQLGEDTQIPAIVAELRAGDPDARARLHEIGFRYVVVDTARANPEVEGAGFGEPVHRGDLWVWDLGPARLRAVRRDRKRPR